MNALKKLLTLAGLLALFVLVAHSQTNPAPAEPKPAAPVGGAVTPPDVAPPAAGTNAAPVVPPNLALEPKPTDDTNAVPGEVVPLIVIDDVPLLDAVKNLARQASLNFQFDPRVSSSTNSPNVTIRFENVTAEDALTAVLENYGLALQRDPQRKISRITIKDAKAEEPVFMRIFQPNYCNASNLVDLLKPMISPRSRVMADARTGQLIAVATMVEHDTISNLLTRLDTPVRQILIEARFIETAKNPSSIKGVDWTGTLSAQNVTFGNGNTAASTLTTTPGLPVTTLGGITPGGRTLPSTTTQPSFTSSTDSRTTVPGSATATPGLSMDTMRGFFPATAFLNADGAKAVLSFINTDSDSQTLATPRTIAQDGTPATMSVVHNYPIFEQQQGALTGGSQQAPTLMPVYDKKVGDTYLSEVGAKLIVTPRIMGGTNVFLDLRPELSALDPVLFSMKLDDKINQAPSFVRRRLQTFASVPSGNTLVIGGLVMDETAKAYTKVPILGDVPVLGAVFRSDSKKRSKSSLLIFVTPTIVGEKDYQPTQTEFLKTRIKENPEVEDWEKKSFNRAQPKDWTKPKTTAADDATETK